MNWIKISEQLPEQDEYKLLSYGCGRAIMGRLVDVNKGARENARTRKDKYPEKLRWVEISSCCYGDYVGLEEFHYWAEIPNGPVVEEKTNV